MRAAIVIFCMTMILIAPALAESYSFTAPSDEAIWSMSMVAQSGAFGTFTETLSDGSTVSGSFSYAGFPPTATVGIGGDSANTLYVTGIAGAPLYMKIWNGDNTTDGRVIRMGYGQINGIWNNVVAANIPRSPTTSFSATYTGSVSFTPDTISYDKAQEQLAENTDLLRSLKAWADWLLTILPDAKNFVEDLLYWIRFFFVDNLLMIVALFLAVPMAFAAKNSKGNPERFLRQYFKTLKGFFVFIMSVWTTLLSSINMILQWFKQWI